MAFPLNFGFLKFKKLCHFLHHPQFSVPHPGVCDPPCFCGSALLRFCLRLGSSSFQNVISRSVDNFTRERSQNLQRVFHNYDPSLHIQEKAVEYVRAPNAVKLDKIGGMDGHIDGVFYMAKNLTQLKSIFSGAMDGDIRLWDIASRHIVCQFPGHPGAVRGLTVSTDGRMLVSCGIDCNVRFWNASADNIMELSNSTKNSVEPASVHHVWKNAYLAIDHQLDSELFTTVGAQVNIWNHNRSEPIILENQIS
ncbi:hypothetical protein PIB30_009235 [Stylosanthes scabra]|uniref:Uncharacterized protein n=1 Tax=Stylosanthes scabra TaxID=79078 RepID=A0ABU6Q549_9FABA|nr:hypothetical protein [Stylosanthes scabra]